MAKCDLCAGECRASDLVQLLQQYQVPGVVDVCPECATWASKRKSALIAETVTTLRAEISAKKVAETGGETVVCHGFFGRLALSVRRGCMGLTHQ